MSRSWYDALGIISSLKCWSDTEYELMGGSACSLD